MDKNSISSNIDKLLKESDPKKRREIFNELTPGEQRILCRYPNPLPRSPDDKDITIGDDH